MVTTRLGYGGGCDGAAQADGPLRATPDAARAFIAFVTRPAFKAKFSAAGLDYRE